MPLFACSLRHCCCSGDVFQKHALAKLRAGSAEGFTTYALNPALSEPQREGKMKVPAGDIVYFSKCAELADAAVGGAYANRIWVPRSPNYATIDLVLPGQRPANFTINEKRPLLLYAKKKTQGLIPVVESLGLPSTGRIPFYWVMPQERFDEVRQSGGGRPFPVLLRGPSRKGADGSAPADGAAPADGTAPADGSDSDEDSDADGGAVSNGGAATGAAPSPTPSALSGGVAAGAAAAPGASALASAAARGRGRPRKQPGVVADGRTSVLDDYVRRIDQYLLLVPFNILKHGAPTPPVAPLA